MPTEPDYCPIPGVDDPYDDEEGIHRYTVDAVDIPSSFYHEKKKRPHTFFSRSFQCRRRLILSLFLISVVAVVVYLGVRRGHIDGSKGKIFFGVIIEEY
jgi:hypothetical protein